MCCREDNEKEDGFVALHVCEIYGIKKLFLALFFCIFVGVCCIPAKET